MILIIQFKDMSLQKANSSLFRSSSVPLCSISSPLEALQLLCYAGNQFKASIHIQENVWHLSSWVCVTSIRMIVFNSISLPVDFIILFFLNSQIVLHCINVPYVYYPFYRLMDIQDDFTSWLL